MKLHSALVVLWVISMDNGGGYFYRFASANPHSLLRWDKTKNEKVITGGRKLIEMNHEQSFDALECNANINFVACEPWTPSSLEQELVVIPCGECRYINSSVESDIHFAKGLDIQGKLQLMPSSTARLTIRTPFIFVQGELAIHDHGSVRGGDGPNLKVLLMDHSVVTGSTDVMLSMDNYVHVQNSHMCSEGSCDVGKRAIVVAGGKLDIKGWNPNCPSWVRLDDVVPKSLPIGCNPNLVTSNGDAEDSPLEDYTFPFTSSGATLTTVNDDDVPERGQFFHAAGRSSGRHGLSVEFLPDCIQFAGSYKWASKVRIHTNEIHDIKVKMEAYDAESDEWSTADDIVSCGGQTFADGFVECSAMYTFKWSMRDQYATRTKYRIIYQISHNTCDVDYDDISFDLLQAPVDKIIVDSTVASCWGASSEILFTSDNEYFDGDQLSIIESIGSTNDTPVGKVTISLTQPIVKPTTMTDSADFAIEVALLNRNILFEPDMTGEANNLHGGHLIVLHTPSVNQLIEGIEVRKFGQQGNIGRYPLHFHMSNNVEGAVIAHNLIRDSNQRCVVVHGTHNLTIFRNVAYDTFGHCYILEEGGELDNQFVGNLGARTKKATVKVGNDETDDEPSTFWMSSPPNIWEGNVAAGSFSHGFWLETRRSVRGHSAMLPENLERVPGESDLGSFRDNVAHSNEGMGVRNYPNQFDPPNYAYFVNTKAYKNQRSGIFLHGMSRGVIEGGVVAANGDYGINIDRADNVKIINTTVMGYINNQSYPCKTNTGVPGSANGIDLHTYVRRRVQYIEMVWFDPAAYFGTALTDVTFTNFEADVCGYERMSEIGYDPDIRDGYFNFWTNFTSLNISSGAEVNMCDAITGGGVNGIVVYDTDGSLSSSFGTNFNGAPAFIVGDTEVMKAFIDVEKQCASQEKMCAQYCQGLCLRTVNFAVPSQFGDLQLFLSDGVKNASYEGYFRSAFLLNGRGEIKLDEDGNAVPDTVTNTDFLNYRYYPVTVPAGATYTAMFKDESGLPVWPLGVETYETYHNLCLPAALNIEFTGPKAIEDQCKELILNGNPEMDMDPIGSHWYQNGGSSIDFVQSDIGGYAILNLERPDENAGVGQFLDKRCLIEGLRYEIKAKVKLIQARDDSVYICEYVTGCLMANIITRSYDAERNIHIENDYDEVAKVQSIPDQGHWLPLYGIFEVTAGMASADTVFLYFAGASPSKNIMLDEVSIAPYVDPTFQDANIIQNGSFNIDTLFWVMQSGSIRVTNVQGDNALEAFERSNTSSGPRQELLAGSLVENQLYEVSVKYQLRDASGEYIVCGNGISCPACKIRSVRGEDYEFATVATFAAPFRPGPDEWSELYGQFTANAFQGNADSHSFRIQDVDIDVDLILDDVSLAPIESPEPCMNLVSNGDAGHGQTEGWKKWGSSTELELICPGAGETGCAFLARDRKSPRNGMVYDSDNMCLREGETWRITAQVKLIDGTTGSGVSCDPNVTWDCPMLRIISSQSGYPNEFIHVEDNSMAWDAKRFTVFNTTFTATKYMETYERNRFIFLGGYEIYDLVVD